MAVTRPDDQRRSALREERDLLLRSLDDLDAEHAAGDLDRHDYETLRDSYTARAAEVLRQLEGGSTASPAGDRTPPAARAGDGPAPGRTRLTRRVAVVGVLALFAVVAGFALARSAGERGVNDGLTGAVDPSNRTRVLECQDLGSSGELLESLQCFDAILTVDPDNAEALTYRGWYLLLAAGSLQTAAADQGADDQSTGAQAVPAPDPAAEAEAAAQAEELIANGLDYLDRAVAADPTLPDPLAFRAVVYDRLGRSAEACADVAALLALEPPDFFVSQTSALAQRNGC